MILLCFGCAGPASAATVAPPAELEVFVRPGCPYCEEAKRFLTDLRRQRPALHVRIRDISQDAEALQELSELAHRSGIRPVGVPAFYLRGELFIGFLSAGTTGKAIELLELLCTAGLPAVYTKVLTAHPLAAWQYYGYLLLYNLALPGR